MRSATRLKIDNHFALRCCAFPRNGLFVVYPKWIIMGVAIYTVGYCASRARAPAKFAAINQSINEYARIPLVPTPTTCPGLRSAT